MKKTNFFLVRHGETFAKTSDNVLGEPYVCGSGSEISRNTHLTDNGRSQMYKIGEQYKKTKFDAVVISDLIRSRESAEELLKGADQIELINNLLVDVRVTEINYGIYDGVVEEKVKQEKKKFFNQNPEIAASPIPYTFPGQENFADASLRVSDAIKDYAKKFRGKNVLIISHSGAMRAFAGSITFGQDLKFGEVIKLKSDGESLALET